MTGAPEGVTVLGAVTVLLLAGNTLAYAATGKALILGGSNQAGKQTSLTRTTTGAVLNLRTKSSANAPLTTNARGKVTNLNADRLDGLDASALRTQSRVFTSSFGHAKKASLTLPVANGSYLVSYSVYAETESDAPISVTCWILEDRAGGVGDVRVGSDTADLAVTHIDHAVSGSGLVTKTADAVIKVSCEAPDGEFRTGQVPTQVVVTPTTRLSTQPLLATVSPLDPF